MKIEYIPLIFASDLPKEVLNWCSYINRYNEYSVHYNIVIVPNDGNVFAVWLINNGYIFSKESDIGDHIGIITT